MTIDEAISILKQYVDYDNPDVPDFYTMEEAIKVIIEVLEQEPKTGYWVELPTHESQSGLPWYECSECNSERCIAVLRDFKYCPNCGAKMAESEE